MNDFTGIIFAYKAYPELRALVEARTSASLPFCARYRLIDFALSSFRNAGITDVGIIMQRDYQSLLDHLASAKPWDMAKRTGGLRLLPPFGLPDYHRGDYSGTMEALICCRRYIESQPQEHFVLLLGNIAANIDLSAICEFHLKSDAPITAICGNYQPDVIHHRYIVGNDGYIKQVLFDRTDSGDGIPSLEGYVIDKETLLDLMDRCKAVGIHRFHGDAIPMFLSQGGKMRPYVHTTYARFIRDVDGYYAANMEMLDPVNAAAVFPEDRPVRTKLSRGFATYYGSNSNSVNSLVSDNCKILGTVENSIIFSGVSIAEGATVKNCILMQNTKIGENVIIDHVIADKKVFVTPGNTLIGSEKLPIVIPKGATI